MILRACLTGAFCALFALGVDRLLGMAGPGAVAALAAVSGFLGSLFASIVLRRNRR